MFTLSLIHLAVLILVKIISRTDHVADDETNVEGINDIRRRS